VCNNAVDFAGGEGLHGRPPIRRSHPMSDQNTPAPISGTPLGEISQAPPAFDAFLDKHQMKLIALAVLLAILAAIYVVYDGIKESGEKTAGNLLVAADDMSELQSVVENHGGTAAAYSAKILLAEQQWEDGQQEDSIKTLKAFIDTETEHPARPSAQASLAAKLRSQGNLDEAKELFTDIAENPEARYLAPYAWIGLGDVALEQEKPEMAEKAYARVEQDFPGSPYLQEAKQRLLLANATAPVEVAAPIEELPDVKFTDDGDGTGVVIPPTGDLEIEDLIEAAKNGEGPNPADLFQPEEDSAPVPE